MSRPDKKLQRVHRKDFEIYRNWLTKEQSLTLVKFIIMNASKYDRVEIFYEAKKQESVLADKTELGLYLVYHRYLFPLITGRPSDENVQLHPDLIENTFVTPKIGYNTASPNNSKSTFGDAVNKEKERILNERVHATRIEQKRNISSIGEELMSTASKHQTSEQNLCAFENMRKLNEEQRARSDPYTCLRFAK